MHLKVNKGGVTFFYKVKQADSWKHFTWKLKCQKIVFITSNVYVICQSDIISFSTPDHSFYYSQISLNHYTVGYSVNCVVIQWLLNIVQYSHFLHQRIKTYLMKHKIIFYYSCLKTLFITFFIHVQLSDKTVYPECTWS